MVISRRDLMHRIRQAGGGGLLLASAAGDRPALAGGASRDGEEPAQRFADYPLNARQFGAKGDGAADDTAALQAAIDRAFATGTDLYIPAGIYRTTAALTVGVPPGGGLTRSGLRIFGAGPGQYGGPGGTEIRYSGAAGSAFAVLQLNSTLWRTCMVEEMTLACETSAGARYGLCFKSTEFSQHTVRRVAIINAGIATAIIAPSGGNGEFTLFDDCYFADVDGWYYTNASQAFVPLFRHCRGSLNYGGIYFNLDLGGLGAGGIEVFDCSATGVQKDGVSNTLLFRNGGSNSVGMFVGGRIEHLTQLYVNQGGTPNLGMPLKIMGMEIGVDFEPASKSRFPRIDAVISSTGNTDSASIESCRFFGDSSTAAFPVKWSGWSDLRFRSCIFEFFSGPPFVISSLYNEHASLSFEDCQAATVSPSRTYRPNALDRHMDAGQLTIGKRRTHSQNAWVASGQPENLLVRPQITLSQGDAVMPDHPWKIAGAGTTIAASDWTGGSARPKSPSPFAKNIVIPPGTSLYQDITSLDLSSQGTFGYYGAEATLVSYQTLVTYLGHGAGRLALADSVTGQVYDQYIFGRGGPQRSTQVITLSAVIERKKTPSFPRLVINNGSPNEPLTFEFAWQFVSGKPNPTFADSTGGPKSYSGEWGAVVESLVAFSRVALPHKPDSFGSAAAPPLGDLASDIYLSSTDGRLTHFVDGKWWKAPRSTVGTAAPTSGAWVKGDKIENIAPSEMGEAGKRYVVVGWICVSQGEPGTWLPMHALTGN